MDYKDISFRKDPDAIVKVTDNLDNYLYLDAHTGNFSEYYLFKNITRFVAKEFMKIKFSFSESIANSQRLDYLLNLQPNAQQTSNQMLYEFAYGMLSSGKIWYRVYKNARAIESISISRVQKAGFTEFDNLALKQRRPTKLLEQYADLIDNLSTTQAQNVLELNSKGKFADDENSSAFDKIDSRLGSLGKQAHDRGMFLTQANETVKDHPAFKAPDSSALSELRSLILGEYNINENILEGKYSEEEYRSFFKTNLQPLIDSINEFVNISLIDYNSYIQGNRITANLDLTQFATLNSFRDFADKAIYDGIINADEARKIIGMAPQPNGLGQILYNNKNANRISNPDGTMYVPPVVNPDGTTTTPAQDGGDNND